MIIRLPFQNKWPYRAAALVSDTNNLYIHMKELVKAIGWRMDDPPCRSELGISYLENGTSFAFVVEDCVSTSAYEAVRNLSNHVIGSLTPIFVLLSENSFEDRSIYEQVLHVGVAKKPLTPSLFTPLLDKYLRLWESPVHTAIRSCAYMIVNGDFDKAEHALKKITVIPQAAAHTVPALMHIHISKHRWKEAETLLLESLKLYPKQISLLLTGAYFYEQAGMPAQALRFYQKLKSIAHQSSIFAFDIAQCAVSLNRFDVAIEAVKDWIRKNPGHEKADIFLSKLLLADGRDDEVNQLKTISKAQARRFIELWSQSEQSTGKPSLPVIPEPQFEAS